MKIKATIVIYLFLFAGSIFGQSKYDKTNLLLLSADYASNTNTFGVTNPIRQPLYIGTFSYLSKYNFDLNYSGIIASNSDSTYSEPTLEHNLSLGYTFEIGKKWSIYPSYTHMFHSKNSYTLTSSFSDVLQNDVSFTGKFYNADLTLNYIFGNHNMFFCSLENALNITFDDFIVKNSSLAFQLGLYLNFSDNNYYNEFFYDDFDSEYFISWISESFSYLTYRIIQARVVLNGLEETKDFFKTQNSELFEPDYKLPSIDIYLPVYYTFNNLMVSATGILNIPTSTNIFYEIDNSFLISFGISYGFEL